MKIEVTASYEKNGKTVSVKATDRMDSNNEEKIRTIKSVIANFIPEGQPFQIESHYHQSTAKSNRKLETDFAAKKQSSTSASLNEPITDPQISLLKKTIKERNISEEDFCKQHQCACVEDLSKNDAQWIIKEMLEKNKR